MRAKLASSTAIAVVGAALAVYAPAAEAQEWLSPAAWRGWLERQVDSVVFPGIATALPVRSPVRVAELAPAGAETDGPSEDVIQSMVCLGSGAAGMAATFAAGPVNIINIIAGGLVTPVNQAAVYISLVGVVFAAFCSIGQAATPTALYIYRQYVGGNGAGQRVSRLGHPGEPMHGPPTGWKTGGVQRIGADLRDALGRPVDFEVVREH